MKQGIGKESDTPSPDKGRAGEGLGVTESLNAPRSPLVRGEVDREGFLPYNKTLTALARENRKNPTAAESRIWNEVLRSRQFIHYKFLRQKPIGGYIVDFYCSELQLVIEIDGDSHATQVEYDAERTRFLNALGLTVLRYTNRDVLQNIEGVFEDLFCRIEAGG